MRVQGHVVKAFSSASLNAAETAVFFIPINPPGAAWLSEVDRLIVGYIRPLLDDLLNQYHTHRQPEGDDMKAREYGPT